MTSLVAYHPLFHAGAFVALVAFAMRNQLVLRVVLLASLFLYIGDETFNSTPPAWPYIVWNALFAVINAYVMVELLLDRTTFGLSAEKKALFTCFPTLSPGEFRRLLKLADSVTLFEAQTLTREGARPDSIYYVVDGALDVVKAGRPKQVQTPTFIGEIAFRRGGGASATVTLGAGGRMLCWPTSRLARYLARHPAMKAAFDRLVSDDLAAKVARG